MASDPALTLRDERDHEDPATTCLLIVQRDSVGEAHGGASFRIGAQLRADPPRFRLCQLAAAGLGLGVFVLHLSPADLAPRIHHGATDDGAGHVAYCPSYRDACSGRG